MFAGVGSPVRRLVRVRIGTLRLDDLATGDVRPLTAAEVRRLRPGSAGYPARMASRSSQTRRVIVALDGPASSGKSSVGAAAAEQLQLRFVDTGLFYRAVTALALLREASRSDDAAGLVQLVDRVSLATTAPGRLTRVLLDGMDATEEARSATVDGFVSAVARVPEVRAALLERQRTLAEPGGIVVAGRDIGTVVLPDADLKLFLDATVEERAQRRIEERGLDPDGEEAEDVREQLRVRDAIDTGREVAPLRAADDAVHVVTDGNAFDDTVEIVAAEIARVMLTPRKTTRSRAKSTASRTAAAAAAAAAVMGSEPEAAAEPDAVAEPEAVPDVEMAPEPEAPPEPEALSEPEAVSDVAPEPEAAVAVAAALDAAPAKAPRRRRPRRPAKTAAAATAVAVEQEPELAPVDPGPFAVGVVVAAPVANPVVGPFAVASDVDVALPVAPEPEPVDPGPFAVAPSPPSSQLANPVVGPFAVASDVDVALPVFPSPSPSTLGRSRSRPSPLVARSRTRSSARSRSRPTWTSPCRSRRSLSPSILGRSRSRPSPLSAHQSPTRSSARSRSRPTWTSPCQSRRSPSPSTLGRSRSRPSSPSRESPTRSSARSRSRPTRTSSCPSHRSPSPSILGRSRSRPSPLSAHQSPTRSSAPSRSPPTRTSSCPSHRSPSPSTPGHSRSRRPPRIRPWRIPWPARSPSPPTSTSSCPPSMSPSPSLSPSPSPSTRARSRSRPSSRCARSRTRPSARSPSRRPWTTSTRDPSEPEPEPEPAPEPAPEPVAAAPARRRSAPKPVAARSSILETAMRLDNDQTMLVRMVALVARIGARAVANVEVEGLENIPRKGAVILAVNHMSNADAFVSGAWISESLKRRRIHWLGKREMFEWPVVGWIGANGGIHPVDRDHADIEAFRLATTILEKGFVLLVFPEGTRSPTGELQEAKDGVAMLAMRTGAQVVPIGDQQHRRRVEEGPAPAARRSRGRRSASGSASRSASQDVIPAGTDRRTAKSLATTAIMGRIAELLDPRHRGVYADAVRPGHTLEDLTRRADPARARSPDVCDHRTAMGTVQEVRIAQPHRVLLRRARGHRQGEGVGRGRQATHTLGQVVHNEGVINDLQAARRAERGHASTTWTSGAAVVIRAHGVKPEVFERAEARGLDVIDGTCTWVIQEQRQLQELVDEGYTIVLLGTPKHPEVVGLLGFAPDAIVVDEEEDWDRIPRRKRMALITQSTQPPWKFERSRRSWSAARTSSRSSTPSARSRSGARRTRSRPRGTWT